MKIIRHFQKQYRFLSNFWLARVLLDGVVYPSVEHAYQAAKTKSKVVREQIRVASTAGVAKQLGRALIVHLDWTIPLKLHIMEGLILEKFRNNTNLRNRLCATAPAKLVEGNYWHDNFWGDCFCARCQATEGHNHLGKILMRVRNEFDPLTATKVARRVL